MVRNRIKNFTSTWVFAPGFWRRLQSAYWAARWFFAPPPFPALHPSNGEISDLPEILAIREGETIWVQKEKVLSHEFLPIGYDFPSHPFVRYFQDGPRALERFYAAHQPKNVSELVFCPDEELKKVEVSRLPWEHSLIPFGQPKMWWGPSDPKVVSRRSKKFSSVAKSVNRNGLIDHEDPITFSAVLVHDQDGKPLDFRVIGGEGNHRRAVLASLGWPILPMQAEKRLHVVRLSELNDWPAVLAGEYSTQAAQACFEAFFRTSETSFD